MSDLRYKDMISEDVKIGQRWRYKSGNLHRIEEVIRFEGERYSSKVKVVQCLGKNDPDLGQIFIESYFDSHAWTLLEGQESP